MRKALGYKPMDQYAACVLGESILCIGEKESSVLHIQRIDSGEEIDTIKLEGVREDGTEKNVYAVSGGEDGRSVGIAAGEDNFINSILLYQVNNWTGHRP